MSVYYNEFEPYAAQWLRNLIAAGHLPGGEVDERDIRDVKPEDVRGYKQCHWFAGVGGWPLATRLAGWPDDRPIWTGSAPCQPFSSAGKRSRQSDERHLWPHWFGLIRECRPPIIFGEQVDESIAMGWADEVFLALEDEGYACASAVLPAYSVTKNHERNRLYFVANSSMQQRIYQPYDWKTQKGLFNNRASWPANTWNEAEPKVYSIHDGFPSCVGICNGLGNAIIPTLGAEFIKTVMEII